MQLSLRDWGQTTAIAALEDPAYLTDQLITYIGNKRQLLSFIGHAVEFVSARLGQKRLSVWDAFSGSGIVSRYLRRYSEKIIASDIEPYSEVISRCYLANRSQVNLQQLRAIHRGLVSKLSNKPLKQGIISELYAPADDIDIKPGDRVFYTRRNARYLDTARELIDQIDASLRHFFLGPLLSQASVHVNTAGVFKGFYKNTRTGIGQFGGTNSDALLRILGEIELPFPIFSSFECDHEVVRADANTLADSLSEVDLAYFDPPYNQHPYGSNYFMLNLLVSYEPPEGISKVSGIPANWNRSQYNRRPLALKTLDDLVTRTKARFILLSLNSEGFVPEAKALALLERHGEVRTFETLYNAFRGSRNLRNRDIYVREHLYLLEKN